MCTDPPSPSEPSTPPAGSSDRPETPLPPPPPQPISDTCLDLANRPPLRTPHAHIYSFSPRRPAGSTAHHDSLYVNYSSPPDPSDTHPAFRRKTAGHVPIIITQDLIDRVARRKSFAKRLRERNKEIHKRLWSTSQKDTTVPVTEVEPETQSRTRPRHIPIKIPERCLIDPSNLTPPPSAGESFTSQTSDLVRGLCFPLGPPTPTSSDCGTPRASTIHILGSTTPATMSRPPTGNAVNGGGGGGTPESAGLNPAQHESEKIPLSMTTSQQSFASDIGRSAEDVVASIESRDYTTAPSGRTVTSPGGAEPRTPTSASNNLSGLVCNVHRCTGKEPRGLVGATTTILGDKLYVFGGRSLSRRRPHMTADLYELDLVHRHWIKIKTKGQTPSPRYFHSVCALGDSKLICYGGMSPAPSNPSASQASPSTEQSDVVVMSDVHIYDTKTRTWTRIDTQDTPQGRYAHCAAVLPSTAVFSSQNAPLSAIHHNPSETNNPNSGQLGLALDGTGGAEMVVVGGQDNANHYIEQISVFNLRSLKWTATNSLGRSCGAYRSVVAPLVGFPASKIGAGVDAAKNAQKEGMTAPDANSMLIYSNYNFLDVRLELQCRTQDGRLEEKPMSGPFNPPGLRFPNGGVLNNHFIISGTYLTSSKQEYALWALDLRTQTWSKIDVGGTVFGQGSWNRGVLWPRRNTFVILGNRKRNLVDDYNQRRINFTNICLVELEAFGLYDNPRLVNPTSSYSSYSAPELPTSLRPGASLWSGGGRPHFSAAEELGKMALSMKQLSDMDILTLSGERIPANSHVLARRWGAYFVQILREGANALAPTITMSMDGMALDGGDDDKDGQTIRNAAGYRNSSITITPSIATAFTSATTLTGGTSSSGTATIASNGTSHGHAPSASITSTSTTLKNDGTNGAGATEESARPFHAPSPASLPASTRSRTLYLPHSAPTVQALLHFLYTNTLPPVGHTLSTPQILCSLLQVARPYRIDGLLEAVLQRLHQAMDSRSAAAVFNACAMAAGGGRGTGFEKFGGGAVLVSEAELEEAHTQAGIERGVVAPPVGPPNGIGAATGPGNPAARAQARAVVSGRIRGAQERKNTFDLGDGRSASQSSTASRDSADASEDEGASGTDTDTGNTTDGSEVWEDGVGGVPGPGTVGGVEEEVWTGDRSCVIGLQKRGLRGLMEGRRMRERGESAGGSSIAGPAGGRA